MLRQEPWPHAVLYIEAVFMSASLIAWLGIAASLSAETSHEVHLMMYYGVRRPHLFAAAREAANMCSATRVALPA